MLSLKEEVEQLKKEKMLLFWHIIMFLMMFKKSQII